MYKVVGVNGGVPGIEASLDIQYMMGVAPGVKTEFWSWPGMDFCADMLAFTDQILADPHPPNVFSVSYGYQGDIASLCGSSTTTVSDVDANLVKIAARGISVIVSSGDSGSDYHAHDGQACKGLHWMNNTTFGGKRMSLFSTYTHAQCCEKASGLDNVTAVAWEPRNVGTMGYCYAYMGSEGTPTPLDGAWAAMTHGTSPHFHYYYYFFLRGWPFFVSRTILISVATNLRHACLYTCGMV